MSPKNETNYNHSILSQSQLNSCWSYRCPCIASAAM